MYRNLIITSTALVFLLGIAAWSQELPPMNGGPQMQGDMQQKQEYREKLRRRAETMMIFFVADELKLEADKENEFVGAMREHIKQKTELDELEAARKKDIAEHLKNKDADKDKLERTLSELEEIRDRRERVEDELKENLKYILSVEQQAKFEMAMPRAREEIMRMLQEAKERQGKNMGPGPKDGGPKGPSGNPPSPGQKNGPGPKKEFKK